MFLPSCLRLSLTALTVHFPSAFSIITTPTESTTQNQQQQSTISGQTCVGTYVFLQIAGRFECLNTPTCWALVRFLSRVNPAMTLQCITRCEWFATAVEATSVGTITSVWALMYLWHTHKLQIIIASHYTCLIADICTHTQPLNTTHNTDTHLIVQAQQQYGSIYPHTGGIASTHSQWCCIRGWGLVTASHDRF